MTGSPEYVQLSIHNEDAALLRSDGDESKQPRRSDVMPTLSHTNWEAKRTAALQRFDRWCKDPGDWMDPVLGTKLREDG